MDTLLENKEILISPESYIDILFMYNKEFYVERIFLSEIDHSQSTCIWTHWFKNLPEDNDPNLTFEIVGYKDEEGNLTTEDMYILVYADQDDDDPEAICVDEINFRKSWCNHKAFR